MPKSRSRSRSKTRTYTAAGNQTVDSKSRQILFNEFEICTMGRTLLKGDEIFTEGTANALLEKHMKTKKPAGYVNFLIDRMRFGKQSGSGTASNREFLNYREIKQFYNFLSRPNVFMLCVEEEKTGKRSYETYMCKNVSDLTRIHDLVKESTSDPQFLLRSHNAIMTQTLPTVIEADSVSRRSVAADTHIVCTQNDPVYKTPASKASIPIRSKRNNSYSTYAENRMTHRQTSPTRTFYTERRTTTPTNLQYSPYEPRSTSTHPFRISREVQRVVPVRTDTPSVVNARPVQSRIPSLSPEPAYNDDNLYRTSRVVSAKGRSRQIGVEKTRARSLNTESDAGRGYWNDDLTYVVANTYDGPQLDDRGSVYLFSSRHKRSDTNKTNSVDSVPVSFIQILQCALY
ncbi:hypothetical protein FBUS_06592 [Fasciolopsis buskii]|uniref:Trematode PH-like domain-containing protein n=1 Tax=Fasciolopsis buskii TaxID=27845 RepID=A0A8E0VEW7_9TREM|nr:hypothetical protein FBUS_06592 [Fasciolopsis buski]